MKLLQQWFLVLTLIIFGAGLGNSRDIYVSLNGTNNFPYTNSWTDAATNIQWAVNVGTNGDTVWISNGVYVLTNQITVISNITISGLSTNDMPVINGNRAGRCFEMATNATGVLANLFITGGYTTNHGGGVKMKYGTVRDCVFSNNYATNYGGGLYIISPGTSMIQRCTFISNVATGWGGGLSIVGGSGVGGITYVDHCLFQTNVSGSEGGGMLSYLTQVFVTDCTFIQNVANGSGGGAYFVPSDSTAYRSYMSGCTFISNVVVSGVGGGLFANLRAYTVTNCYFSYNVSVNGTGGGLEIRGSYGGRVMNCRFYRNKALSALANVGYGGGLRSYACNTPVSDCFFEENSAYNGGGIWVEGAAQVATPKIIRNCMVARNTAVVNGGGICFGTTADPYLRFISSCTIVSNYAGASGGGISCDATAATNYFENSIIYFNQAGNTFSNYYLSATASSAFSNCCFSPALTSAVAVAWSSNNITADPGMVDWPGGNYRLRGNSLCVNAGTNQSWMTNAVDLGGNIRIRYGVVDMGVYEKLYSGTIFSSM